MTEREQVIAELLYLKHDCLEGSATDQTLDKALALLKAQEPKMMDGNYCPTCEFALGWSVDELGGIENIRYCPHCGQAVKWE